jgi:hypothetical protein
MATLIGQRQQFADAYVKDFRGLLGWAAWPGQTQEFQVELFIKDHPIAGRNLTPTEISTQPAFDAISQKDVSTQALFFGAPEMLQINCSGWLITPITNGQLQPKGLDGVDIANTTGMSNGEVVNAFLDGRMITGAGGAGIRYDPTYYITPYGQRFNNPKIMNFDVQFTTVQRKQSFTMGIYLEY